MTETMQVTPEEKQIIMSRRADEAHKVATELFRLKAIKVTSEFFNWSAQNNLSSPTFSTFINEFGYQEHDGELMHAAVNKIWGLVFTFNIPKEKSQ